MAARPGGESRRSNDDQTNDQLLLLERIDAFRTMGLQVHRRALAGDTLKLVQHYCRIKRAAIRPLYRDALCPAAYSVYADLMSEAMLASLQPLFEAITGVELTPTFSYLRVYGRGCSFGAHVDRAACEISGSLAVAQSGATQWPLMFELSGQPIAVSLAEGDLVVYRGSAIPHWRETFEDEYQAQLILNYVTQAGKFASWAYDRRTSLGVPLSASTMQQPKLACKSEPGDDAVALD